MSIRSPTKRQGMTRQAKNRRPSLSPKSKSPNLHSSSMIRRSTSWLAKPTLRITKPAKPCENRTSCRSQRKIRWRPAHDYDRAGSWLWRRRPGASVVVVVAKRCGAGDRQTLKKKLEELPNMRVMLTRDGDFFVPLQTRVAKARGVQADLFVSIHADAFVDTSARGSSVLSCQKRCQLDRSTLVSAKKTMPT